MATRVETVRKAAASVDSPRAHDHRTARVIEVIGSSRKGFDQAIQNALEDASATTRGITGAHVVNMSVKCDNGKVLEYKVDLRIAFGIERTSPP